MHGLGFGVQGVGCREFCGLRGEDLRFRGQGVGRRMQGVQGLEGLGLRM
jgi:hypothetical protein